MRKLFLVGALALFGAMNAQLKFGPKAGLVLSSLKADSRSSHDIRMNRAPDAEPFLLSDYISVLQNTHLAKQLYPPHFWHWF